MESGSQSSGENHGAGASETGENHGAGTNGTDERNELGSGAEANKRNYMLARNRPRITIHPPSRQADLISYALNIAEEVEYQEPMKYKEAVSSKNKGN